MCSEEPIGLRKPTADDAAGSPLREHVYAEFSKYLLPMDRVLPDEVDVEEIVLRDGNEWRATRGQSVLADRTWPIIQRRELDARLLADNSDAPRAVGRLLRCTT